MTQKLTIRDIQNWQGKRALVREDFNVPLDAQLNITDDTRIREALPTLQYLTGQGAKVIIMSHLGRPKGKPSPEFSLAPVAKRLQELLPAIKVHFAATPLAEDTPAKIAQMGSGEILLLENIRFAPGEEKNDPALAKQLAALGDVYVNDAFGTAHRAHASTEGVAHYLQPKVAGLLMAKEIETLSTVLNSPEPLTAIIGGSKISTKITVLENLLEKVQHLVIGGGMLFTFLKAQGKAVGNSLVEDDFVDTARQLLSKGAGKIVLATDVVIADAFKADATSKTVSVDTIPDSWMGLDIGPDSVANLQGILKQSPLVLWNGPLGVFEFPVFANGTRQIAETLAQLTEQGLSRTVLGGGDTVAAIEQFGIDPNRYSHVSTGGGASLEFLEGKVLPGIAALDDASVPVA
ncbi:phosphoglycerate kinase [Vampirovibrio chlorellavorus]|uniref:phosphoglycerate kinase n=1 Tax=Vampirovibrio chlorellavorus TaxID=758823 RepID=UPI0026F2A795|nr:phosphoglycerate kinase [Vampirovibrio chlorellavorus]